MNTERPKLQLVTSPESHLVITERGKKIRKSLLIASGTALLVGVGVNGLVSEHGGAQSPDQFGPVDPSIESVTIAADANLRFDPYVGTGEDSNILPRLEEPITIDAHNDIHVRSDTANGTWYGIPESDIKAVDHEFNDQGDNDGVIWVNEQKVSVTKE